VLGARVADVPAAPAPLAVPAPVAAAVLEAAPLPAASIFAGGVVASASRDATSAFEGLALPRYDLAEQLDISQWAHVATQGRDHYVRIVYEGHFKELGHRCALVKVTERRFEDGPTGSPVAYLRQFTYIVVRDPEKLYAGEDLEHDGRGMPLKRVRLTTVVTPHLDPLDPSKQDPANPDLITDRSFWVRVNGADFLFHGIAEDVNGRRLDFEKALVFVPNSETNYALIHKHFDSPAGRARRSMRVPGQKLAFAAPAAGNDNTVFTTVSLNFKNESATREGFFKPQLFKAEVRIPAVEQLAGAGTTATIGFAPRYLSHGFEDPSNLTGAFAVIGKDTGGPELAGAGMPLGFSAQQAGGFATPNLDLTVLTRSAGPLGGSVGDALKNEFDPTQIFKKGLATLFGVFDLAELLPKGRADQQAPCMQVRQQGSTLVTALDWESPVKNSSPGAGVVDFVEHDDTRLSVHVEIKKALAGAAAADSFTLDGRLNHFDVVFFQVVKVNFRLFHFVAQNGRKPDVNVELDSALPVEFQGDLAFVEGLRKLIPPGVFGDGVSIDLVQNPLGVRAGLAISLPPADVGVFSLKNIAFSAGLTIPFLDGKPTVDFAFARRENPFLLAISLLGGGGFFHIELDTSGIRMLEAAFEFGAVAALDIGVASGEVHIMAGIYFKMEKKKIPDLGNAEVMVSLLTGYLRCGGKLCVLGIVSISVEFYLSFTYVPEKATGRATLTVAVEIACFSKSVELTVERSFGSKGGDPTFAQLMETPELWASYAGAFA
jgi:hypothetical protein